MVDGSFSHAQGNGATLHTRRLWVLGAGLFHLKEGTLGSKAAAWWGAPHLCNVPCQLRCLALCWLAIRHYVVCQPCKEGCQRGELRWPCLRHRLPAAKRARPAGKAHHRVHCVASEAFVFTGIEVFLRTHLDRFHAADPAPCEDELLRPRPPHNARQELRASSPARGEEASRCVVKAQQITHSLREVGGTRVAHPGMIPSLVSGKANWALAPASASRQQSHCPHHRLQMIGRICIVCDGCLQLTTDPQVASKRQLCASSQCKSIHYCNSWHWQSLHIESLIHHAALPMPHHAHVGTCG